MQAGATLPSWAAVVLLGATAAACSSSSERQVQCRSSGDCIGVNYGLVCSSDGRCVSCETNDQCGDPPGRCGAAGTDGLRRCEEGECVIDADCAEPTPRCDGTTFDCVAACVRDEECAAPTPVCDSGRGLCSTCGAIGAADPDAWCAANRPPSVFCDTDGGACRSAECRIDPRDTTACTDPARPECAAPGRCVACESFGTAMDDQCREWYGDARPLCSPTSHRCEPRQCDPGLPPNTCRDPGRGACDPDGRCVPCDDASLPLPLRGDDYCEHHYPGARPVCSGGECVGHACTDSGSCSPGQYCDRTLVPEARCVPGCDPAVTGTGPGSCAHDCGAGLPQACLAASHTCRCLAGYLPGTDGMLDADGCLAVSAGGLCLTHDSTEGAAPPSGGTTTTGGLVLETAIVE